MNKFRYFYGFLILIILISGISIAKTVGAWESVEIDNSPEIKLIGLPEPRGRNNLGEIIEAYDLDKKEFYEALNLPMDCPENSQVLSLISTGVITFEDINDYMVPIIEEFELMHRND